jgi:PDZ domain-containing protein
MFEQSELIAAGAAAQAAGMPVTQSGRGARVVAVAPGAPASRVLAKDDVITAVDGAPISINEDVGAAIRSRPAGTTFTFTIERNGHTIDVKVTSALGIAQQGPAVGIVTETRDLTVRLPFKIAFRERDIGGTSAGLAYALAVYDLIKPGDLAHGRSIAATGTIDVAGHVGPIGGVREKAEAARKAGAQLFLVPTEELAGAQGNGLATHAVDTLQDAIALLRRAS